MARSLMGAGVADFVYGVFELAGRQLVDLEPANLTLWSAKTGGTQYTDLLLDGVAVTSIPVGEDGQVPQFQGPDGITSVWADAGGPRVLMTNMEGLAAQAVAAAASVNREAANGVAGLDASGKLYASRIPSTAWDASGAVGRTDRTRHAPALGLYFPEAEGATLGSANNAAALAATFAAAPAGATVDLGLGNWEYDTPIAITKSVKIKGPGAGYYLARLMADGCNGIEVAAGVDGVQIEGVEIISKVRYTTTVNALVGIKVAGSTGSRPFSHVYRDVYVDGFQTAFQSQYLWASYFDNFRCDFGLVGLDIYGLSVNNMVANCQIGVAMVAGSRGIRLAGQEAAGSSTDVGSEGWIIHDSLIFGGEIGVEVAGNTHIDIHDNIIDFSLVYGVLIRDNGTNFGGNCDVHDNYVAMSGAVGTAAIGVSNTVSNVQNRGNNIHDNHLVVYSGSTCTNGIFIGHSQSFSTIESNTIKGFSTSGNAINLAGAGNIVRSNRCLDTPGAGMNIYGSGFVNQIEGNEGSVYLTGGNPDAYSTDALGKKVWLGLQAHTTGTHAWGDRVVNSRPTVGQPKGWRCTVAGTPGTWVSEGNL